MKQRIYVVSYREQRNDKEMCVQTMKPVQWVMEQSARVIGGLRNVTIRPLMLNGRFLTYRNGHAEMI